MRTKRTEVLDAVQAAHGALTKDCDDRLSAVGWSEISNLLGVTARHCQDLFFGDGFLSARFLEKFCSTTYVLIPPTRMSVLRTVPEDEDRNWDRLGEALPIVCPPEVVSRCRKMGGPFFNRVVDLWKRFPRVRDEELAEINGGYAMVSRTKARPIPVCWDTRDMLRMNRFRKRCDSIARAAAGSRLTIVEYLEIKSPDSHQYDQGVLSVVAQQNELKRRIDHDC